MGQVIRKDSRDGYAVYDADVFDQIGGLYSNTFGRLKVAAQNAQDRKMLAEITKIEQAADAEDYDKLGQLSYDFVRHYPNQPDGHFFMALVYLRSSQWDYVLVEVGRLEMLGIPWQEFAVLRGAAYGGNNNFEAALECFSQLIRLPEGQQERPLAFQKRAEVLLKIGDLDLALSDINRALAEEPNAVRYFLRGEIEQARGDHKQAIHSYTVANSLNHKDQYILEARAKAYEIVGQVERAQADRVAASGVK